MTSTSILEKSTFETRLSKFRKFNHMKRSFEPLAKPEFSEYTANDNIVSSCVWNLDKKQDWVWCHSTTIAMFSICVDGHGTNEIIDWFKSKPDTYWLHICKENEPLEVLEECLYAEVDTHSSGACITLIRTNIDSNVEIFYLGDVVSYVYVNNVRVAETESHLPTNPDERARKLSQGATFEKEYMMYQLSKDEMTMKNLDRCNHSSYSNDHCLQMTRCLGHSKITGDNYGYLTVSFNKTDNVKIISASDGVFDVVHSSEELYDFYDAFELVNYAAQKWCSDWKYVHPEKHSCVKCNNITNEEKVITIQKGVKPDDISATMITLRAQ